MPKKQKKKIDYVDLGSLFLALSVLGATGAEIYQTNSIVFFWMMFPSLALIIYGTFQNNCMED